MPNVILFGISGPASDLLRLLDYPPLYTIQIVSCVMDLHRTTFARSLPPQQYLYNTVSCLLNFSLQCHPVQLLITSLLQTHLYPDDAWLQGRFPVVFESIYHDTIPQASWSTWGVQPLPCNLPMDGWHTQQPSRWLLRRLRRHFKMILKTHHRSKGCAHSPGFQSFRQQ